MWTQSVRRMKDKRRNWVQLEAEVEQEGRKEVVVNKQQADC